MRPKSEGEDVDPIMDLTRYAIEDLVLVAIKSEHDSYEAYINLAGRVKNAFLKDKLKFLAEEERKHRRILEDLFVLNYPDRPVVLPEHPVVPLPVIRIEDETLPLSEVIGQAMVAERAACEFYTALAGRMANPDTQTMLKFFANMEQGHFQLLDLEKKNLEQFEQFDGMWPMMHVGP